MQDADFDTGHDAFGASIDWIVSALLGSAATVIATLAVATVGVMIMFGRMPVRRGTGVIIGCAIVVSAGQLSRALVSMNREPQLEMPQVDAAPPPAAPTKAMPYDPFAGAAVPVAQESPLIR